MSWQDILAELERKRAFSASMGGKERLERVAGAGKLTAVINSPGFSAVSKTLVKKLSPAMLRWLVLMVAPRPTMPAG